jgi:WD40 repeat protein
VRLWNAATLDFTSSLFCSHSALVDVDYDPTTDTLLVGAHDNTLSLINITDRRLMRTLRLGKRLMLRDPSRNDVYRPQLRIPEQTPPMPFPDLKVATSALARAWSLKNNRLLQRMWATHSATETFKAVLVPEATATLSAVTGCIAAKRPDGTTDMNVFLGADDGHIRGILCPNVVPTVGSSAQDLTLPFETQSVVSDWAVHEQRVTRLRAYLEMDALVSCSLDSDIHFSNLERGIVLRSMRGTPKRETLRTHSRGVNGFELCRNPKMLISYGLERFAVVWDITVAKPVQYVQRR